ncbi:hypothetical protein L1280_001964 [Deinococcus sp. HSC-46F16]|uniref:hypothetical protein n=1 Tax=Deinococcus sp. HSC-46F16 TaxID=2910968 RepID=UPI00209FD369|nr:hypothetical protein [Deinococcus sp. HSC-46F16]MCP2014812.1 hypothetical protein [Deinococcus sp. HSC-46F16]
MKKLGMMLVVGGTLLGQVQAQSASGGTRFVDIGQDIIVSVYNVCTFAGSNNAIDSEFDRNNTADPITFDYRANQASSGSGQVFNIRCTAGTPVRVTRGGEGGDGSELGTGENESETTLQKVGNASATPLRVILNERLNMTMSDGTNTSPDRYVLRLNVRAPAGQFGVEKGDYAKTLVYRFEYDE